jgi:uncharacterized protein (DUF924 family)
MSANTQTADAVLDFWFGPGPGEKTRPEWFRKDPAFDREISTRFGALIEHALAGGIDAWADAPLPALARVIVLDQFTRNTFRDTARAFAGDAQALAAAQRIVTLGWNVGYSGVQRQFCYLPFEHAEDRGMQQQALTLFAQLGQDHPELAELLKWAQAHHDIVARFGRFPHRNAVLGRASSAEEVAFLSQPGSSF